MTPGHRLAVASVAPGTAAPAKDAPGTGAFGTGSAIPAGHPPAGVAPPAPAVALDRVRPPRPGRGLHMAASCMLLAAIGLGAALLLDPPPAALMLPMLAVVLGLLAGMAGLYAGARSVPAPAQLCRDGPAASPRVPDLTAGIAERQALLQELHGLVVLQRDEVAAFREQSGAATHEAMLLSARLAGVALDAETRLAAATARADEAALRAERVLPEFADVLRRGLLENQAASRAVAAGGEGAEAGHAAAREMAQDAMAARIEAAADGMVRTVGAVMADAAAQIATLADTAVALRREAGGIDEAARATAGMLAGTTRGAQHVGVVLYEVRTATSRLAGTAADSAAEMATMRQGLLDLTQIAGDMTGVAGGLTANAARLERAGQAMAAAGAAAADRLTADADALAERIGRQISVQVAERIAAEMAGRVGEQVAAVLCDVPRAAADMTGAAEALRHESTALGEVASRVTADHEVSAQAMHSAAARVEMSAASLDAAGRAICTAGEAVGAQSEQLEMRVVQLSAQAAAQEVWMPGVADRLVQGVARLEAVGTPKSDPQLIEMFSEIGRAMRRLETALDRQDGMDRHLAAVVRQVQETVAAVASLGEMPARDLQGRAAPPRSSLVDALPGVVVSAPPLSGGTQGLLAEVEASILRLSGVAQVLGRERTASNRGGASARPA